MALLNNKVRDRVEELWFDDLDERELNDVVVDIRWLRGPSLMTIPAGTEERKEDTWPWAELGISSLATASEFWDPTVAIVLPVVFPKPGKLVEVGSPLDKPAILAGLSAGPTFCWAALCASFAALAFIQAAFEGIGIMLTNCFDEFSINGKFELDAFVGDWLRIKAKVFKNNSSVGVVQDKEILEIKIGGATDSEYSQLADETQTAFLSRCLIRPKKCGDAADGPNRIGCPEFSTSRLKHTRDR
ncbi:hypothetical protein C8J56DRAFT_893849 [Mycena floridula]|nr:hypothetical protein C8J56DRAFT_893849 [Mycena floridula]